VNGANIAQSVYKRGFSPQRISATTLDFRVRI